MRKFTSRSWFQFQRPATALTPVLLALLVAGCGGGGGGSSGVPSSGQQQPPGGSGAGSGTPGGGTDTGTPGGTNNPPPVTTLPAPVDPATPLTMSCVDDATYQCSGDTVIRTDNGILLTRSGVQVLGKSTMDLPTNATGLALLSSGSAEVRVAKQRTGTTLSAVTGFGLLLKQLGIQWDGSTDRPTIIEGFNPTAGRTVLGAGDTLTSAALPPSSDLTFYNFVRGATPGTAGTGTQANYANNRYFPRDQVANPSRCDPSVTPCPTVETLGFSVTAGDWPTGGSDSDRIAASRLHEDGDVHAGDGQFDALGNPIPAGLGVPYPGSKGYREYEGHSYSTSNLGEWVTQDTVDMAEWAGGTNEHNTKRRGMIAFGDVADPTTIPTTGTATYTGTVYGTYTPNGNTTDSDPFRATLTLSVDFATRLVTVQLTNATTNTATPVAVPLTFTATIGMGAAGQSVANYMNGKVENTSFTGGIGARFFGTVLGGGAPTELGGVFSLSNGTTKLASLGGFLLQKQP